MAIILLLLSFVIQDGFAANADPAALAVGAPPPLSVVRPGDPIAAGGELARNFCASCHFFADPDLLDRKTWLGGTLPRMKIRLGLAPEYLDRHPEAEFLKASGTYSTFPLISEDDWKLIQNYYTAGAPEIAVPQEARSPIGDGVPLFAPQPPKYRRKIPASTMVHVSKSGTRIFVGDAGMKSLDILGADGTFLSSIDLGNIPVSLAETQQGLYLTLIGSFLPSDKHLAELAFLPGNGDGFDRPKTILRDLPRATHTQFADLNGDGKTDFVICLYGNSMGRLAWYENTGNENYKEHVLIPKSGALRTVVKDLNGDTTPDIAVLMAQESEAMFFLLNDGKGNFTIHPIFQKHPLYGHSYFEFADFNRDGRADLLVTNGDNGEYASPTKRYHGIRIYLNNGDETFKETYFYPLNGAYKAMARDFDEDGDLDIAAISFFPDYEKSPAESFVFLENQGGLEFKAATFRQCISGRWLTMDTADLDGDKDLDIVLGSYIEGPTDVPPFFGDLWHRMGPSVLILKNTLRSP